MTLCWNVPEDQDCEDAAAAVSLAMAFARSDVMGAFVIMRDAVDRRDVVAHLALIATVMGYSITRSGLAITRITGETLGPPDEAHQHLANAVLAHPPVVAMIDEHALGGIAGRLSHLLNNQAAQLAPDDPQGLLRQLALHPSPRAITGLLTADWAPPSPPGTRSAEGQADDA